MKTFELYWQYDSIGADNGLAPNKRQAFIWTIVSMFDMRRSASMS